MTDPAVTTRRRNRAVMVALCEAAPFRRTRDRARTVIALLISAGLHGITLAGFLAWDEREPEETVMMISLVSEWAEETSLTSEVPAAATPAPPMPIALPREVPGLEPESEDEIEEVVLEPEPIPAIITSPLDLDAAMPALPVALPVEPSLPAPDSVEITQFEPIPPPPKRPPARRRAERLVQQAPARAVPPPNVEAEVSPPAPPAALAAPVKESSIAADRDQGASPAAAVMASGPSPDRSAQTLSERLPESYRQALLKWLERRKFYPPAARRERLEGRIVLRIRLDRDGRVLGSSVADGSGHAILDDAALDLVRRAGDAPPLPEDFPADQAEIVAPLSFSLK